MTTLFFDTHCHLDDPSLSRDLPAVLAQARAVGVCGFVIPGVHPGAWPAIASLAALHHDVHPAFGVHPMHADLVTPDVLAELASRIAGATAIGEIGLDYALPFPAREVQRDAFRAQLRIAARSERPVLIHCRKAFADLLAIMEEERTGDVGGVMHAYSGSPEIARDCIRLGLHISCAGTVTYANAVRPPAVAADVPLDRLLLETDAPDLAPEPYRGGINLPKYLVATAARVAQVRGIDLEELARATTSNARRLFRL